MAELTVEALAGMSDEQVTVLQSGLEKKLEAGAPYDEGENPAGIKDQLKMVKTEVRRRKSRESAPELMDPEFKEARIRALKVPNPKFMIDRMKKGQESLVLSGASHETLAGETFILVNEIIKEGEPPLAFGRVTFSQQDTSIRNTRALGSRRASVDPLMLREFDAREGPLFVLKFKLLKAFATPKRLAKSPPGRFSSFINFEESKLDEAFHLSDTHWVPVPESGTCPSTHPTKLKFPGTETLRCFTPSAAESVRARSQESESLSEQAEQPKSKKGLTVEQTLEAVSKQERKFTQEEANFKEKASDPAVVCGVCRFYLRDPSSEIGRCQVVDGPIPWFATSDLYISADAEARAVFNPGMQEKYDGRRGPQFKALKDNKVNISDDERQIIMDSKAVWHHGPNGEETPAVWKSVVNEKTWFVCNTHRAYNVMPTIRGAIHQFHGFIKSTA